MLGNKLKNRTKIFKRLNLGKTNQVKNDAYEVKTSHLKQKIIFNFCISAALIIIVIAIVFYDNFVTRNANLNINALRVEINDLKDKSANIESRVNDLKKYKQIWLTADEKKKDFSGIKISDLNDNFKNLSSKYDLSAPTITVSAPEILKEGIYKRTNLDVQLVSCTINFQSLTDRVAIDFISELINSIPGYVIVNDMSIKKNKKNYSENDLIDISTGKTVALTLSKVTFSWYSIKNKTP